MNLSNACLKINFTQLSLPDASQAISQPRLVGVFQNMTVDVVGVIGLRGKFHRMPGTHRDVSVDDLGLQYKEIAWPQAEVSFFSTANVFQIRFHSSAY